MKTKIFHRWTGLMVLCASSLALPVQIATAGLSATEPPNASPLTVFDAGDTDGFASLGLAPLWGGVDEALSVPLAAAAGRTIQVDPTYRPARLRFERNEGQFDSEVEFLAREAGCDLFLTRDEAVMVLFRATQREAKDDGRWPSSADFESAGSGISNPPAPRASNGLPTGSRRYSRLETCATSSGFLDRVREPSVERAVLRMRLAGASFSAPVRGENELRGKVNYFLGNDPARWRTNIATFGQVRFQGVYPGIDLVYYGNQGQLEYDFVVAPGADPNAISLAFEGADKLELDGHGDLLVAVAGQFIRWQRPRVYQRVDGDQREVAGNYVLDRVLTHHASRIRHHVAFSLAGYDRSKPVIIDPVLLYSTYLGGSSVTDAATSLAVDPQGNAYVFGVTESADFPVKNPLQTFRGMEDLFVTKLGPTGELLFSTCLGGNSWALEGFGGIAVDAAGSAYLTGFTWTTNFPMRSAFMPENHGIWPAGYLVKLALDGSALSYSTYLPGIGTGVAVDASGSACVVGAVRQADYTNFPVKNAVPPQFGGTGDGFVLKLDPSGTNLVYATFLGGSDSDRLEAVALDKQGNACVAGRTYSWDFPVTNAVQSQFAGGTHDGVFAKISADGSKLLFASYLGGSDDDILERVAVGPDGDLYLAGITMSSDFPVVHPFQGTFQPSSYPNAYNVVVTRVKADGSGIVFSTYFGGSDYLYALALDSQTNVYFAGDAGITAGLPLVNALQTVGNPLEDGWHGVGFLGVLSADGSTLRFSTLWGGTGSAGLEGMALDALGNIYLAGQTWSADFPLMNPLQAVLKGGADAFVTKLSPLVPLALPSLQVLRSGASVSITWPATAAGFVLESTPSLTAPSWSSVADAPVIIGDQNVVTLDATNAARFFRLSLQ